jgi:hypothetical protein
MTTCNTTPADLEQDGIVYGMAQACVDALREAADAATAQRFVRVVAQQVAQAHGPTAVTPENVAAHLNTNLSGLVAAVAQLHQAGLGHDC